LSLAEHGAYNQLLDSYYSEEELPSDPGTLYRIAGAMDDLERKAVDKVVKKYFTVHGDRLVQDRVERELAARRDFLAEQARKAKLGAKARWGEKSREKTGGECPGHARTMPTGMPSGTGDDMPGPCQERTEKPQETSECECPGHARTMPTGMPSGTGDDMPGPCPDDAQASASASAFALALRSATASAVKDPEQVQKPSSPAKRKKQPAPLLPKEIDPAVWEGFEENRRKLRKPLTDRARALIFARLERFRTGSRADPNAVLEQSIERGWTGVFPLSRDGPAGGNGQEPKGWAGLREWKKQREEARGGRGDVRKGDGDPAGDVPGAGSKARGP
jgi:uncharacterized protein YdaU (DUF1376 family)